MLVAYANLGCQVWFTNMKFFEKLTAHYVINSARLTQLRYEKNNAKKFIRRVSGIKKASMYDWADTMMDESSQKTSISVHRDGGISIEMTNGHYHINTSSTLIQVIGWCSQRSDGNAHVTSEERIAILETQWCPTTLRPPRLIESFKSQRSGVDITFISQI